MKKVTGLALPTENQKHFMVSDCGVESTRVKFIRSLDIVAIEQLQGKLDNLVTNQLQYTDDEMFGYQIYLSDALYEDDIKLFKGFDEQPSF